MIDPFSQAIHDWQTFYILVGTSSATLTGLIFIAASLGTGLVSSNLTTSVHTWVTPVIVHFSAVLLICILLTVPTLTALSLAALLGISASGGLLYVRHIRDSMNIQAQSANIQSSDRLWHVVLLAIAYSLILVTAIGTLFSLSLILNVLGLALALLLIISLRNTWDLLIWIAEQRNRP